MTAVPVPQPNPPSEAELKTRAVILAFAAEFGLAERGRPLGEVRMNQLAKRIAAVFEPKQRPRDPVPAAPKGMAARSAARKALDAPESQLPPAGPTGASLEPVGAAPVPSVVEALPDPALAARVTVVDRQIVALIAMGLSNVVIGERVGLSAEQVRGKVRRLRDLLGSETREGVPGAAERTGILRVGVRGAVAGAALPSDGPTGHGSPSGPTRSPEAHTEPYSATGPQAATQAARA